MKYSPIHKWKCEKINAFIIMVILLKYFLLLNSFLKQGSGPGLGLPELCHFLFQFLVVGQQLLHLFLCVCVTRPCV